MNEQINERMIGLTALITVRAIVTDMHFSAEFFSLYAT